jgi:hypothetical protein
MIIISCSAADNTPYRRAHEVSSRLVLRKLPSMPRKFFVTGSKHYPWPCLDHPLGGSTVSSGLTDRCDTAGHRSVHYIDLRPDVFEEFLSGDHAVGMLYEVYEDLVDLGLELNGYAGAAQFIALSVENTIIKSVLHAPPFYALQDARVTPAALGQSTPP